MGRYDTIRGTCPHCGTTDFESQTKLTPDPDFLSYSVGDVVPGIHGKLLLKNACASCHRTVVAKFGGAGRLEKLTTGLRDAPDYEELPWGGRVKWRKPI